MKLSIFFIVCILQIGQSLRFCIWHGKQVENLKQYNSQQPPKVDTKQKQQIQTNNNPKIMNNAQATKVEEWKQKVQQEQEPSEKYKKYPWNMFNKGQPFRSYHPHYLHSYSYPQPVSPHLYFGQLNNQNNYVFLLRNNQTLLGYEETAQIFYINGKQEYGADGLNGNKNLRKDTSNINNMQLGFAMVLQMQNMLPQNIQTDIQVINYGRYLGIICKVYEGYYKSFIVYLSQDGKKAQNLTLESSQYTIQFKNQTSYNNKMSWRNAQDEGSISRIAKVNISSDPLVVNHFNTFVMTIKYNSVRSLRKYKIIVRQFPQPVQYLAQEEQQDISEHKQVYSYEYLLSSLSKIYIDSFSYKILFDDPKQIQNCQYRAEKQLLQGLSYQYGTLSLKNGSNILPNQPKQLLSFSPSRKRFPWGFLWDDGFHCQVAVRSQPQITIKVIKSWLDTMFDFGWIPRQQNRGPERQFLCSCPNYMTKDVRDGNPPTLLLALSFLAKEGVLSNKNFEKKYWLKLKSWYNWFLQTQTNQKGSYIFRWYDSIKVESSFNSGMDDFPRISNTVGHVDCQSWVYFFAQTLSDIALALDYQDQFSSQAIKIRQKFMQNFIDPNLKVPNDFTIINGNKKYNDHFGYPSILPIAFGMLDWSTESFNKTLEKIKGELDSGYGLTSISQKDRLYLQNRDAYWKGPVWININYLFIRGLNLYYPYQMEYYKKLRRNIINTVCGQLEEKDYFFQNYIKGIGSFSFPFTGWTALISIIIRQNY